MFAKGVSRRWMVNTIGVVFLILTISITTLSIMVQSSLYNGIEQALAGRADELLNWLSTGGQYNSSSEFMSGDISRFSPTRTRWRSWPWTATGRCSSHLRVLYPTRTRKCPIMRKPCKIP